MKRLNYYQVHKNKKPVNRKAKRNFNVGFNFTYCKGSYFHKSFSVFKKRYNSEEINKFIETALKDQKKKRYLNRIKK